MFVRLLFSFYFCVKRVIFFRGSRFPVHTRRGSASPHLGGSPFLGNLYAVHTSCVSNTSFPGWDFAVCGRRERVARAAGAQEGWTPTVSTPLVNLHVSLWATSERRNVPFLLRGGTEKGTAVPLLPNRLGLTPTIPFAAALKLLEVCYTQLRKTSAICRDNAAAAQKTEADTVPLCELLTK